MSMLSKYLVNRAKAQIAKRKLPLKVVFWDGTEYTPPVPQKLLLRLHSPEALKALARPTLGSLASAYVEGQFDLEGDIRDVLALGEQLSDATNAKDKKGIPLLSRWHHTRAADRRNIHGHYDVSNDFYALWLDARRVYSCGYFRHPDDSLDKAQEQKLDLICRKLMLQSGERFLDIGCGWGALLFWAAEHYGVNAVGITLSAEQHAYVSREIERRGLTGQVEVLLKDYRELDVTQPFDKIASVGMFEHVGNSRLDAYFDTMWRLLKRGGLAMNHGITSMGHDTNALRSGIGDFVERYVFPGGELVNVARVLDAMAKSGFECLDVESLRPHYAKTLWHWVDRLEARADQARAIVGEKKYRIWRTYMAGSANAFSYGWISLHQVLAGKPNDDGALNYPYTRDHLALPGVKPSMSAIAS